MRYSLRRCSRDIYATTTQFQKSDSACRYDDNTTTTNTTKRPSDSCNKTDASQRAYPNDFSAWLDLPQERSTPRNLPATAASPAAQKVPKSTLIAVPPPTALSVDAPRRGATDAMWFHSVSPAWAWRKMRLISAAWSAHSSYAYEYCSSPLMQLDTSGRPRRASNIPAWIQLTCITAQSSRCSSDAGSWSIGVLRGDIGGRRRCSPGIRSRLERQPG